MKTAELKLTPDLSDMMLSAYEISDLIKHSDIMAKYQYYKEAMNADREVQLLRKEFLKKKEKFDECQRFGHFHPNYHEAMNEVYQIQEKLDEIDSVREYKKAENELDQLLYTVSEILAKAVSEDIKVPSNNPLPTGGGCGTGGCGSGGSCNCG